MVLRLRALLLLAFVVVFTSLSVGQLSGTKVIDNTGAGDYASFTLAISALNAQGVGSGGVTFNITAGQTFNENPPTITASGSSSTPIVFQRAGIGANPVVSPALAGSLSPAAFGDNGDWIFRIQSGDYITFDGIDLHENPAFTGNVQKTEYGYFLVRTATNGCKNITIRNCTITLDKATQHSTAIYSSNLDAAGATVVVTTNGGRAENIRISGITCANSYNGIHVRGYNHIVAPFGLYDQNIDIGVDGANAISNYGGGSAYAAYGIYAIFANNVRIHNNLISGGANTTADLRGITTSTGTNSNLEIIGNDISISSNLTNASAMAIDNAMGGSGTGNAVTIRRNVIHDCSFPSATTGAFAAIMSNLAPFVFTVDSNIIRNNTLAGTGTFTGMDTHNARTMIVRANQVYANQKTGASGTMYCTRTANAAITYENNHVHNNFFPSVSGTAASLLFGYFNNSAPASELLRNNVIDSLWLAGATTPRGSQVIGINSISGTGTVKTFEGNTIHALTANVGSVFGVSTSNAASATITGNRIHNLSVLGSGNFVYGINVSAGTAVYIINNQISDLRAPVSVLNPAISGLFISGGTTTGVYFNTIFLNATAPSAFFGSAGITVSTTPSLDLRDNIVVNLSAAGASGQTVAFRRTGTNLATYAAASNNNDFYAGTPGPLNYIYHDGTTGDQTIAAFKTRVSPRDAGSFTENPPFVDVANRPYNLHINPLVQTLLEAGGSAVTSPVAVTLDADGDLRNSTPDVGADEFVGATIDTTSPTLAYTPLASTSYSANRTITATITDAGGIAGAPNGPRLYYKKSTDGSYVVDSAPTGSSPNFVFTINTALLGGGSVAPGDVIQYYVAAADVQGNAVTLPAGGSGLPPGIVPPPVPNSYTILAATPLPFAESFDGSSSLPAGWAGTMGVIGGHGTSGTNGLTGHLSAGLPTLQVTSPIVGQISPAARLAFDYRIVDDASYPSTATVLSAGDSVVVFLSTDDGATFAPLHRINQSNHVSTTAFAHLSIPVPTASGLNCMIRWILYRGSGDYHVDIDNAGIAEYIAPPDPAGIVSPLNSAVNVNVATSLTWSAPASGGSVSGYKLYIGTDGGGTVSPTSIVNGTNLGNVLTYAPASALGFATTYYWQVVPTGPGGDAAGAPIWSFTTALRTYTIDASAGANGTITPSGSVVADSGTSQNFTIAPSSGFLIDSVLVDGAFAGRNASYQFTAISANHTIRAVFAPVPPPVGGMTIIDDFNGPALASISGVKKWVTFGHNETGGTIQRNADSTISPYSPTLPGRGGVAWDSLLTDGTKIGLVVRQKGNNGTAVTTFYLYFRMNGTDLTTSSGYCLLYMERPTAADLLYLMRATSGNSLTSIATLVREILPGDTLMAKVETNKTMKILVHGANGVRDSISAVDNTYNPAQWYCWIRGVVLPTPVKMDNFMIGTTTPAAQARFNAPAEEAAWRSTEYRIAQNYPNPFNPTTSIRYQIADAGHVTVKVYDVLGREVATLVDEVNDAGVYTVAFDAGGLGSGLYFYRIRSGNFTETRSMILMR